MLPESVIVKAAGAVAGSILALVFIVPRTLSGFFRRTVASLIGGFVFAPVILAYLGWPYLWEHLLASAAAASFATWWAMGPIVTLLRKMIGDKGQTTE